MKWDSPENTMLVQALLSLDSADEAKRFLRDLMTEKEIDEFGKRLKAASMLTEDVPYTTIQQETGLSSATVARVAKWLNGELSGYRDILDKIHHQNTVSTQTGSELS